MRSRSNAVDEVRRAIQPGDVFDYENTYHTRPRVKRYRIDEFTSKNRYRCTVLAGELAGKEFHGSIPERVSDVIGVGPDVIAWKMRGSKAEGHTVTLRRVELHEAGTCDPCDDVRQLTVTGEAEPIPEPEPSGQHEQDRLFTAPETIRGQLAMDAE